MPLHGDKTDALLSGIHHRVVLHAVVGVIDVARCEAASLVNKCSREHKGKLGSDMAMFRHRGAGGGLKQENPGAIVGWQLHDPTLNAGPDPAPASELIA